MIFEVQQPLVLHAVPVTHILAQVDENLCAVLARSHQLLVVASPKCDCGVEAIIYQIVLKHRRVVLPVRKHAPARRARNYCRLECRVEARGRRTPSIDAAQRDRIIAWRRTPRRSSCVIRIRGAKNVTLDYEGLVLF